MMGFALVIALSLTMLAAPVQGHLATTPSQVGPSSSLAPASSPEVSQPPKRHPHDEKIEQLFEQARLIPKEISEHLREAWRQFKELFP